MQESVTYSQLSFIMSVLVISYQETANRIKKVIRNEIGFPFHSFMIGPLSLPSFLNQSDAKRKP